jgi:Replication factor-A C terminal domain
LSQKGATTACSKCEQTDFVWCARINVRLADETNDFYASLFDAEIEHLLDQKVENLHRLFNENLDEYKQTMNSLIHKPFFGNFRMKKNNFVSYIYIAHINERI